VEPPQCVRRLDALFSHFVEHGAHPREFIRGSNPEPQRVRRGDRGTRLARRSVQCVEVLSDEGRDEKAAQGFASATLRTDRRSERVHLAEGSDETGLAAFIAGAAPRLAAGLSWKRPNSSFVLETVAMLVGPLTAGVVAIEARATWAPDHGELRGAP
jgi:hypothetical protein